TAKVDIIYDLQFLTEEDTMVSLARIFVPGFLSQVVGVSGTTWVKVNPWKISLVCLRRIQLETRLVDP
ncbi:hypothetical protein Tco_1287507, partial [Tanacetum coccineum]